MRTMVAAAVLALVAGAARAQERLPQEEAQGYARTLADAAKGVDDAPLKAEVDPDKPVAIRAEDHKHGVMVIPARGLSAAALDKADKEVVPVGQLWLHNLAPVVDGNPVPADKLRILTVTINGDDAQLPLCFLGARKKPDGGWELLVYGKDKEPLARLAMKAIEGDADTPLDLEGKRNENDTGDLTIKVLGKHKATLVLGAMP